MPKRDQVAVRRENKQFTLAVGLVGRAVDIGFGQEVELRLELLVEAIHIMHVNVVGEAAVAGRGAVRTFLLEETEAHRFAVDVGIVLEAEKHLEAQRLGEERQGPRDIGDVHERRDLDKVRQGASSRREGITDLARRERSLRTTDDPFGISRPVKLGLMNLRPAIPADISGMVALERACPAAAHWTERQHRQAVQPESNDPERLVLVAEASPATEEETGQVSAGQVSRSSIVGFLVARHLASEWELENIVVAPAARRKGLGKQLLDALLAAARQTDNESVFLEVRESNTGAIGFYKGREFRQIGLRASYYQNPAEAALVLAFENKLD